MRVPKFLKDVFHRVCGQARTVAESLSIKPARKLVTFYPRDGANQFIPSIGGTPLSLLTTANPGRVNDRVYRIDRAAMAVLTAIRMDRVGISALSQAKNFSMDGYPPIAAANVFDRASRFAYHPEYGPRILGERLHEGRVILMVAMRSSFNIPDEARNYGATVYGGLADTLKPRK